MTFETQQFDHGTSTSTTFNGEVNKTILKDSENIQLVLPVLKELQNNHQTKVPARSSGYPLTLKEYQYLFDLLPDLKDLRYIWGRNRIEYLYLSQQLIIMPLAGSRHEAAVSETVKWIEKPIERRKDKYEDNQDKLSPKERKTWEWYKLLFNAGAASIDCVQSSHGPDASFGPRNKGIRPLVLEVADSQKSEALSDLAMEYLGLGKGLIKYMFAVDIREVAYGVDVDFKMWKHIKVGKNNHSAKQCASYPLVRADGTQVDTTVTISYPLSDILGSPPRGCENLKVELHISDLIERITSILPRKKLDRHNGKKIKRAPGISITPPRFQRQRDAVQEFEEYDSGSEDDDEENDASYQPSS